MNNVKPVNLEPHRELKEGERQVGFANTKYGIRYRFVIDEDYNRFFIPEEPLKQQTHEISN